MTFHISRRGREYLKAVQTLLRAAQTITDRAIADRLKALADDYERRAEKVSHVDAAKAFALSAAQNVPLLIKARDELGPDMSSLGKKAGMRIRRAELEMRKWMRRTFFA